MPPPRLPDTFDTFKSRVGDIINSSTPRNDAFQAGNTVNPAYRSAQESFVGGLPKPSAPPKSGGRDFYPPQAPKPPAPPKFGGDPGFKGPSQKQKPQPPKSGLPKPGKTIKPMPYTGTPGGTKQTLPYTGTPGGLTKTLPYTGGAN